MPTMTAEEQMHWCNVNYATVWHTRRGIRVKVEDVNTMSGSTMEEAIGKIESIRKSRAMVYKAFKSLDEKR